VAVRGVAVHQHAEGTPVRLRITHQGAQVWPDAGDAILDDAQPDGWRPRLDDLRVRAGDEIRFEVQSLGTRGPEDAVSWSPLIGYLADQAG
jgi:hypothetical protein